jgi:hypothetical protein
VTFLGEFVMKKCVPLLLAGVVSIAFCVQANAQNSTPTSPPDTPKTRAEVIGEIATWRSAGYDPIINLTHYPDSALRAAHTLAAQHPQAATHTQ